MSNSRTASRIREIQAPVREEPKDNARYTDTGTHKGRCRYEKPQTGNRSMELTPAHLEVVRFVQAYTSDHVSVPDARELSKVMAAHFERQGGRDYLYRLFPKDPVTQACRLAGLEIPSQDD